MLLNKTISTLCLLCVFAAVTHTAQAQKSLPYNNPQITEAKFSDAFNRSAMAIRGAEIGLHRRISDRFTVGLPISIGAVRVRPSNNLPLGRSRMMSTLDLLATFYATKPTAWIRPYLQLGPSLQRNWEEKKFAGQFPVGAGFAIPLSEAHGASLDLGTQFRPSSNDINGWHHHLGFTFNLDAGDKTPPPPPPPADTDGDGIVDMADKCPETPGLAALMGCPDADMDGIADGDDKCPSVKGLPALMGCPDTDMDGVTDADDKCPTVKGSPMLMGCPDTDGDGIGDAEDKCPKEAGPKSNNGCPVKVEITDRDGDGVADASDSCPDVKGEARYKGCPDTDGDMVPDNADKCPKEAGAVSNGGCPEIKAADKAKIDFAIKNIRFKTGSNVITNESYAILDEVANVLAAYPGYYVSIGGHTDSDGDAAANQRLSEGRAKACYDYLAKKGVTTARMSYAGYGETLPKNDNKTAADKLENRRVEFVLFIPK
jgi:OmpA-OmpF porin, OOP family